MIRLALNDAAASLLQSHLLETTGQEQGAFCLVRTGQGHRDTRLLVTEILFPPLDAWETQGAAILRPSAKWISAAVSRAIEARSGLLFIHSHPDPAFPPGLSPVDISSFRSLAETLAPMLEGPFASLVAHPAAWTGVVWSGGNIIGIDRVVSLGRTLSFLSKLPAVQHTPLDDRQQDALGVVHNRLRSLTVAVVGAGGLGSPMAEQLVRMGVAELILVDNDVLDTDSNVRRVFGARMSDLNLPHPKPKVQVVADYLESLGLGVYIHPVRGDVRTERTFRHLLDSDVVLNGTDTHSSRATVNELASTYLLPVIDVGVRVSAKSHKRLSGLFAEVRVLTPTTPCLWCRKTINSDVIRAENLPSVDRERLQIEGYVVQGIGTPVPSVAALTVLGSGLATSALLTLLSAEGDVAPSGYVVDGFLGDSLYMGPDQPRPGCRCRLQLGLGDSSPPPFQIEP